jgi:hypothetical protein
MKPNRKGCREMTLTEFSRLGGLTKSEAKSKAARENGKLGGRPKKKETPNAGSKRAKKVF